MDLNFRGFETFEDLKHYCYHVAGAVGLCCIHVWGFREERALQLAVDCGLAFQLTNIIRDVAEDARVGRCYIPREDLQRFGLTPADLSSDREYLRLRELLAWEAVRARESFLSARQLIPLCKPQGRPILDAMIRTYGALLGAIESSNFDVSRRISLGRPRKLAIVLGSLWRHRWRQDWFRSRGCE